MNNIAIFASGSGTNAENIINHFNKKKNAKVVLVLTENPKAFVLERAAKLGIPSIQFTLEELKNGSVLESLKLYCVDYIVLAGFLKLFPTEIIDAFPNRIVNIHPALLPKYGGKGMYGDRVHKAIIEAGEKESGITIHYVNTKYDEGGIIFQAKCSILETDTPETLAQKVHQLEYRYYPEILTKLIDEL